MDRSYSPREAVDVLEELNEFEKSDRGLWEGQDFETAMAICVSFTFGNAVGSFFSDLIKEINEDDDIAKLSEEFQALENKAVDEDHDIADIAKMKERIEIQMKENIEILCKNFED